MAYDFASRLSWCQYGFAQTESGPDQISRRSAGMLYARCRYLSVRGIGQFVGFAPGTGFAL